MKERLTFLRRGAIAAIAGLLFAGLAASAAAQTPTRIRFQLDWRFEGPAALFLLPVAKGYFKQEGLDVIVDAGNGSAGTVTRVASGAYDMGFADITAMIEFLAANQGLPSARMQAVFLLYDTTAAAVFVLKKSGITKPSDLNGKTMGAPVFDAGRKAFPLFMKANKLDASKIKWQSMDPPLRETMLARGEVDGITGFYFTSLLNLNARGVKDEEVLAFKYPDYGVNIYGNVVLANQRFIDSNPQAISAFLRALTRGVREVIQNPDDSIKYVKERDPLIDEALERRRLKLAIDTVIATPEFKSSGIGAVSKLRLEDTVAQVVEAFNLKTTPNTDTIFNSTFLPSRGERQVFAK
ncbi:MAG TPA: ABC transporter substrate-binding protein [Burkholderiales bacterium]|nr:ABC transporter substrate-binding protein [Burkholderiales bacterium]